MTQCRVSYRDGTRIKNEAMKPYVEKAAKLGGGLVLLSVIFTVVGRLAKGLPLFGGASELERRVLDGSMEAVVDLVELQSVDQMTIMMAMLGGCFFMFFILEGASAASAALREENARIIQEEDPSEEAER